MFSCPLLDKRSLFCLHNQPLASYLEHHNLPNVIKLSHQSHRIQNNTGYIKAKKERKQTFSLLSENNYRYNNVFERQKYVKSDETV